MPRIGSFCLPGTLVPMGSLDVKREMDGNDIARVGELLVAATTPDGRRPLSDHLYLDLVDGGGDGFAGFVATTDGDDRPVAYAQLSAGNEARLFELVVRPDRRGDLADVGAELLDAAFDVVATDGGGTIVWWVAGPTDEHHRLAAEAGMQEHRRLHQMRRPLPTGRAVTIDTRAFRPGDDDEAWLRVNNRAFADHDEQGGWTLDTLRARQSEEWFDPDGFRIHERDGEMAGFCWTKIHPAVGGVESLGEIYVIAVDPTFHGSGLGTQLTLAGLEWLSDHGLATGMLYVDARNSPAIAMYEHLGFHIRSTDVSFAATVRP